MAEAAQTLDAASASNRITGSRRWWVLVAVMVTMFFSSMDQTVVSTAMPVIIGDLKGFSLYAWVFSAYMMASAVTVPIYGKLSDVYGRKPFYIFGLLVFIIGSAVSGQAHTMMELILARAGQGIGAGAMLSMPRATIGDIFNPRERGRWMGLIGAVFGLASIIGPSLGGWITDTLGWQWVFYINLPIAAFALLLVWIFMPAVRMPQKVRPDYFGSVILVIGLLAVLLGFTWAGSTYPWGSWQIVSLFAAGVIVLAGFILYERRQKDPILSPELFRNEIFTSTTIVGLFVAMGLFGTMMFLPLFAQGVLGLSAAASGAVMTPMMLAFIVGSVVGGQMISRTGKYKMLAIFSGFVMVIGTYLLTRMGVGTGYGIVIRNVIILGLGVGSLMPLLNVAVQNAFPYEIMGMVNSTQQFVSSLGGVIAAPILGSILTDTFARELPKALPKALTQTFARLPDAARSRLLNPQTLTSAPAQAALKSQFAQFGAAGGQLYRAFLHAVHVALSAGISDLYKVGLVFAVLALAGTFFLKELNLKHDEYYQQES